MRTIGKNGPNFKQPVFKEIKRVVNLSTQNDNQGAGTGEASLEVQPGPPVQTDINYMQGFLKTNIGKYVKIEFLIGTNLFVDKEGYVEQVGIDYIVLKEARTGNRLMCDIYSIKFVTFLETKNISKFS